MTGTQGTRVGAVIAVALVAAFLVWYFVIRDSGDNSPFSGGQPTEISDSDSGVAKLAGAAGHPVYWVGTRPGTKLEATLLDNGNAYVRYLGSNAEIGDPEPNFLTIGTYPVTNAYGALRDASKQPGAVVKQAPDNGLVVTNTSSPNSVYVAYRDKDLQIEVYDPDPKQARQLATSGAVTPVD
jgi:hypothetical protein